MSATDQRLDIVIFGATGYTGKYAIREVHKLSKEKGPLTWGIAGRNEKKLSAVLNEASEKTGDDLSKIKIFIADVNQENSLLQMAKSARVVVNCAGPYRFYGEPVVKACVASGTHHVDISGEPEYMEKMQLKYHKEAEEKGIYIVSACGFDSIPSDMGSVYLQNNFGGTVNSVETYLETKVTGSHKVGLHYGTWESAIYGLAHSDELRPLRQKLFPNRLPKLNPRLKARSLLCKSDVVDGWCLPFLGADKSVMKRSQYYFYEKEKQRPIQIETYITFKSLFLVAVISLVAGVFAVLARWRCGRSLLLKFPGFFSLGLVSHEGPSEEGNKNTQFSVTLNGEGWKDKLTEPSDQFAEPVNKKMIVKVSGRDPGYEATCVMLLASACMILRESEKMPGRGGVYAPGAAFAKTSMIHHLSENGIKFEVVSSL